MKFFSADGPLYKFLSRLWDIIKINVVWFVCSLPLVTIGVSTIAAYTVILKMLDENEGYVVRGFFKAFKANLKPGFILSPITLLFAVVIYLDLSLVSMSDELWVFIIVFLTIFLFLIAMLYTYPLLARYDNTVFRTIKNSMRISMRYFGKTILLVVLIAIEVVIFLFTRVTMIIGALVGPGVIMMTISGFALSFFREIEKEGGAVRPKTPEDEDDSDK